ncbi:MAG: sulfatase-like hydrolase/transferase [Candidatus Caenarcaniphilales bacterium]|nr:sulfatase-like hydrolase/transferase [Candidatus Caenarcaniphilales bacterium]
MFKVSKLVNKLKKKIKFALDERAYKNHSVSELGALQQTTEQLNYLWIVYDSCRYDTLLKASTPVLDSYAKIYPAWSPATYTLPAHISFFAGILPIVYEEVPYLNRFYKQLITMRKAGEARKEAIDDMTLFLPESDKDIIHGFNSLGYHTVGSAAASWFSKEILVKNFQDFQFKRVQSFPEQINYISKSIKENAENKPFFAFMNLIETHSPYMHYGADREEYGIKARGEMQFPPEEDELERTERGVKLHKAQIEAAEYCDAQLESLFSNLPANTLVVLTADHGEAFGEDGFWGHGIYHPTVMNVPMSCFKLDRSLEL